LSTVLKASLWACHRTGSWHRDSWDGMATVIGLASAAVAGLTSAMVAGLT